MCDTSWPTLFYHEQLRGVKHEKTYLSLVDVEEFRTGIPGAGTGLAPLLKVEYPSADLDSATLCDESEVVEGYSMTGKWVTSWASSAKNDFLVTLCIREVSGSGPFLIWPASFVYLTRISFVEYLAGGD